MLNRHKRVLRLATRMGAHMSPNSQTVTITEGVYEALCDYLRERQDTRDGGDGTPLPNDAMHLLFQLTEDAKRSGPEERVAVLEEVREFLYKQYHTSKPAADVLDALEQFLNDAAPQEIANTQPSAEGQAQASLPARASSDATSDGGHK